jgi:hypothetical protein
MKILSKIIIILGFFIFMYHYHTTANGECITKNNAACYCPCGAKPTPNDYTYKILADYHNKCSKCCHTRMPGQPAIFITHISHKKLSTYQEQNDAIESKETTLLKKIAAQLE